MNGIIHIPLTKQEVLQALKTALSHNFIDNLRNRHPLVALDSKLRGYVGELAFKKWANANQVNFINSNVKDFSSGMDIDFVCKKNNGEFLYIELKTSLIPDVDQDIQELMNKRDIKLIQRNNKPIEELRGDLHVQLVFKQLRLRKDDWLRKQSIDLTTTVENIYDQIAAYRYKKDCYLVGWIDKVSLVQQINNKPEHLKRWKYGQRAFWICNLEREAKQPEQLIHYLT